MTIREKCASNLLAAGMACALLAFAGPASAKDVTVLGQAPADHLTTIISYADLDLGTPAGANELSLRVASAVDYVCSPHDQRSTFQEYGACRSYARNGARPQMDQAIARAREIARSGVSAIAPVAISISGSGN